MKIKASLFFILLVQICFCQVDSSSVILPENLKVGVVLSGGGAKGLAHIGALKVIEEAGIHIDYIAGTSMGSIIGGLYAAGYSPQQMDSIFYSTNFNTLIRDELPRTAKTFYEREADEKYALNLNFDRFKVSIPSGLSKGQNVYNFFSQLTSHIETEDFSELSVPFFGVATNLETGEEVVLDSGSLALAMSVSGAIPTVFRPIELNGKLHTDGGVANNYPVEELRRRGANFIIGVDVQDSLYTREQLTSGLDIMAQIGNFRTINAMKPKAELTDIYIRPDIKSYSVLDFDKGEEIIANGIEATLQHIAALQQIAKAQNKPVTAKHVHLKDSLSIKNIQLSGNTNFSRSYIQGKLKIEQNEKVAFRQLNQGINNLSATNNFNRIHYNLEKTENEKYNIHFDIYESKNKRQLRLGLHYDDLYKSGILANFTQKKLLVNNDVFSFDLVLGENIRYYLSYYLDKGRYWSIGFRSRFNRFRSDIDFSFVQDVVGGDFDNFNVNKIQVLSEDFTNQLYAETLLLHDFRFGLGIEQKWLQARTETILVDQLEEEELAPETIIEQLNLISTYGYLEFDTLSHKYYPTKGLYFYGDMHIYLTSILDTDAISQFSIVKGEAAYVQPISKKLALKIGSEIGFRIGNESNAGLNFFLGGFGINYINNFRPFYGYDFLSLSGDAYVKGNIDLFYNFYKKHYLIGSANFANVENNLFDDTSWLSNPNFSGYAIGYGLDTFFGPIDLKYSYSPEVKKGIWFFSLGHRF